MDERGLFWWDVQAAIGLLSGVRHCRGDNLGRTKWIIDGKATDSTVIEIVYGPGDDRGHQMVFITLYWIRDQP